MYNKMDKLLEDYWLANFSGFIQGTPILLCTKPSHSHRNEILMGNKINIFIIQASENSQHIWIYKIF